MEGALLAKVLLSAAKRIQDGIPRALPPRDDGAIPITQQVLPFSVIAGTRGYIERVANQINGCYENGWFDGCAVMVRRLLETLIVEAFEHHGIAHKIKDANGNFVYLAELISKTLSETRWNLTRNAKAALPRLKDIGDRSAHSRRFVAHRRDIDKIIDDLRVVSQELLYLAALK